MKIFTKYLYIFSTTLLASAVAHAACTVKVVNHSSRSFEEMGAKASIFNLAIPICTQLADQDEVVKENCSAAPTNTLFSHPHYETTCASTDGWPVYLQFSDGSQSLCSDRQTTIDRNVVVSYPEDFSVKKCGYTKSH